MASIEDSVLATNPLPLEAHLACSAGVFLSHDDNNSAIVFGHMHSRGLKTHQRSETHTAGFRLKLETYLLRIRLH